MNHLHVDNEPRLSPARLAIQAACIAALLAGCGGGGSSTTPVDAGSSAAPPAATVQSVPLQTYITDNLATEYSKVWVSIEKITAVDGAGAEVTLLDATAAPVVANLSSLAAVGHFLSNVKIPVGVYREVRITLQNTVQLVSLDGSSTINARFAASGPDFVIRVGGIVVDTASSGQLVLDFNLARFTYDAASGLVAPTIEVPKPADAFGKFVRQQAELHGVVKSIDLARQTLTIDDPRLGDGVVVTFGADAVIVDDASGKTVALAAVAVGAKVEIKGVVKPGATTADASTVIAAIVHVAAPPVAAVRTVSGSGKVKSVAGHLITVSLDEASFLPGANSVVVDSSAARFSHGKAGDLLPGVGFEFRGALNGSGASAVVIASDIDVQGAPSQSEQQKDPAQTYAAVNGAIAALTGSHAFTVTVVKADGQYIVPGPYSVDATSATYLSGNAGCLAPGKVVQAIGSLAGNALKARFINVAGCAGVPHSEPAPAAPPAPASAPASGAK